MVSFDSRKIYTSHAISAFFLLHLQNVDLPRLFAGENKPYKLVSLFHPVVTFSVELPFSFI